MTHLEDILHQPGVVALESFVVSICCKVVQPVCGDALLVLLTQSLDEDDCELQRSGGNVTFHSPFPLMLLNYIYNFNNYINQNTVKETGFYEHFHEHHWILQCAKRRNIKTTIAHLCLHSLKPNHFNECHISRLLLTTYCWTIFIAIQWDKPMRWQ